MRETPQLTGLIHDLRKSTSRIDQLKILTRAWKTVQNLSPAERVEVAKHIGMREGLPLLERFGRPGGVSPAALAQAVVKAEQSSPGQLNQILRDLRKSSTRVRGIRESVEMLDTVLNQESSETKASSSPVGSEREATPLPPNSAPPPVSRPTGEKSRVVSPETPPPKEIPTPPSEPVAAAPPAAAASPAVPLKPPPPLPAEVKASHRAPPSKSRPDATSWGRPFQLPEPEREPESVPAASAIKTSSAGLLRSFRKLERLIDTDPGLEERLDTILSELPPGWPRRRALSLLIRSGAVSETSKVLSAIASLGGPFDEFWCLSAWLQGAEPSREELQTALRQTRGAPGKRLLRRHLDRAL